MRCTLLLVLFFIVNSSTLAQSVSDEGEEDLSFTDDRMILKGDFFNVVNPEDPSLLLSLEYFLNPWLSISQEAGIVAGVLSQDDPESFFGLKSRQEVRYYFSEFGESRIYVSLNWMYRYLEVRDEYILAFGCGDFGDCDYYQNYQGKIKTDRSAGQLRFGLSGKLSNKITLEADLGLGLRNYTTRGDFFDDARFVEEDRFLNEDQFGWASFITLSGKLGWVIWKRRTKNP